MTLLSPSYSSFSSTGGFAFDGAPRTHRIRPHGRIGLLRHAVPILNILLLFLVQLRESFIILFQITQSLPIPLPDKDEETAAGEGGDDENSDGDNDTKQFIALRLTVTAGARLYFA